MRSVAGLAHEGRSRVGVDVVEVDLERHQAERREARRPADRHVVGGADGRAGDVGAGGGAHVAGRALAHAAAQLVDHAEGVEGVEQPEGVAAAHHHDLRLEDRPVRGARAVRGDDLDAERSERGDGPVGVVVPVRQRVGDERHHVAGRDAGEGLGGVREHRAAVVGGVREQEQLHVRRSGRPAPEAITRASCCRVRGRLRVPRWGERAGGPAPAAGSAATGDAGEPGAPAGGPAHRVCEDVLRGGSPASPQACPSGQWLP